MKQIKNYHWLSHCAGAPASLANWLVYSGSFIQRLKAKGITDPQVHVLGQQWEFPTADERLMLKLPCRTYVLVREVLINSVEADWMLARTIFPTMTLTGQELQLSRLKNRSLGSVLFRDATTVRSDFEFLSLQPHTETYNKINQIINLKSKPVWARRSLFFIKTKPLLLSEVFLPAVGDLL